jgi:hypothetical protein
MVGPTIAKKPALDPNTARIPAVFTAELIAVRRHAERALPHMSWFHRQNAVADDDARIGLEEQPEKI